MVVEEVTLIIMPALVIGAIIGLIEMVFVHSDEIGMGWFGHGLHAFPFTILFTFINMNVGFVLGLLNFGWTETIWVDLGIRAVIAIIGMTKIAAAAAIAGRVGERIQHTIMIGVLLFVAPYVWNLIGPFIPLPNLF